MKIILINFLSDGEKTNIAMKELSIGFDVLDESIIKEFLTEIKLLRYDKIILKIL